MLGHLLEPGAKLRPRVAGMGLLEPVPAAVGLARGLAQICRHQIVLRAEVAIERHLVGAGSLGDGIDPYGPDSMPVKQIAGDRQNAGARRNSLVFPVG